MEPAALLYVSSHPIADMDLYRTRRAAAQRSHWARRRSSFPMDISLTNSSTRSLWPRYGHDATYHRSRTIKAKNLVPIETQTLTDLGKSHSDRAERTRREATVNVYLGSSPGRVNSLTRLLLAGLGYLSGTVTRLVTSAHGGGERRNGLKRGSPQRTNRHNV